MKKLFAAVLLTVSVLWTHLSFAGWAGGLIPTRIYGAGQIMFATDQQPAGTCNYFNSFFQFDSTTAAGRTMLAILLTAKATGKKIDVWYTDSTAPGTTETNGCDNKTTESQLTGIGFSSP